MWSTQTMRSFDVAKKGDVHSILEMLVYIADENTSTRSVPQTPRGVLTRADIEAAQWRHVEARINRRRKVLGDDLVADEDDDGDALLLVVDCLATSKQPLTTFELMRALQRSRLLSHEFPSAARAQCLGMLERLRVAGKVWQDTHGRWALV